MSEDFRRKHMIPVSEETKKKISESMKGRGEWLIGRHHSLETRKKMSLRQMGHFVSEETRRKISEASRVENPIVKSRGYSAMRKWVKKLGISPEEVRKLWNSPCGLCGIVPLQTGKSSCIDHDHSSNTLRGPLCDRHNQDVEALVRFLQSGLLEKALEWIKRTDEIPRLGRRDMQ